MFSAPEVLNEEPAFPQTDIWTVGVLTYVMLSGVVPFKGQDENETRQNISFVRYRFEHLYKEISQEGTRFLMLLFKRQPKYFFYEPGNSLLIDSVSANDLPQKSVTKTGGCYRRNL
jgi:serine/threonine protein kinase